MLDPDWLPSTVATCSAALVAIVGGLFAGRVIAGQQELQQRRSLHSKLQADLDRVTEQQKDVRRQLLMNHARVWIAKVLSYLAEAGGELSSAALLRQAPAELSPAELEPFLEECKVVLRDTKGALALRRDDDEMPAQWVRARQRYPIGYADDYKDMISAEAYRVEFQRRMAGKESPLGLVEEVSELADPVAVALRGLRPTVQLEHELASLNTAASASRAQLAGLGSYSDAAPYRFLLMSLVSAAALGVLFPLIVLGVQPTSPPVVLRVFLVIAAAASFSGVLLALILEARRSAPSSPGGEKVANDNPDAAVAGGRTPDRGSGDHGHR